jgi:hypothetical protein
VFGDGGYFVEMKHQQYKSNANETHIINMSEKLVFAGKIL